MGQVASTGSAEKRVFLTSVLGITVPGLSELTTELNRAGYLSLPSTFLTRGAGLVTTFPKVRLATLVTFTSYSGTTTDLNRSSWARGTQVGTSLGVLLSRSERVQFIPYVGLAYSFFGTRVSETAPASTVFPGYLAGPANQQYVGAEQFIGNVGLHLAKSGLGQGALSQKLILGLRAGYMLPLANPKWQTNNVPLSDGPDANPGGTYLHVIFGSAL